MKIMRKTTPKHGLGLIWSTRGISLYVNWAVFGYLIYYCTDYLGLNVAILGTISLASKIIDAISNFIFAYICDNTHFKLGKGRPWEIAVIPLWLTVIGSFAVPASWGNTAKYILVFIYITLNQAVFSTILLCVDNIYFKHAFKDEKQRTSIQAVYGALSMMAMMAASIVMPLLINYFEHLPNGWVLMGTIIAIPMAIIGSLRFLLIPEVDLEKNADSAHVTVKDTIQAFISNKYVIIIALVCLVINVLNNFNGTPGTYYFTYIVGDLSKQSIVNVASVIAVASLLIFVPLANKYGRVNMLKYCMLISGIGCSLRFLAGANVMLLSISSLITSLSTYAYGAVGGLLLIDAMDYGEWKNHKRVEGAVFAGYSLGSTLGAGIGSAIVGILMNGFGYDGTANVQSATAITGIRVCYGLVPSVLLILVFFILQFYDLDEKMPAIHKELAERSADRQ